jgi:hypothetical protein
MAPLPRGRGTIVPRVIEEKARHQVGQRRAGLRRKRLPGWILRWADAVWHAEQLDLHASGLMPGRVAELVEIGVWRHLRRDEVIVSCGKVNALNGRLLGKCLPSVDLAHGDLTGCEQCPEQHGGSFR